MAAFTAQDVKTLREKTGCGMMDCKKALTNADGDMDKAVDFLREQGLAKQAKKAGRIAAEGVAYACTNDDLSVGVVVEVNAETDFVAKNDSFMDFVKACANTIIEQNPADVEALLTLTATGSEQTIAEMLQEKVLTIGENIQIRRFERMEGACVAYVHAGGKIGVLVNFDTDLAAKPEFVAYGRDVAMQIAALRPQYTSRDEVSADYIAHEKEILMAQIQNDPKESQKPEKVIQGMIQGRINKELKEICLLDQVYVKAEDGKQSVAQYVAQVAKANNATVAVKGFVRFETGEGIEKKEENFAEEVAKQMNA